VPGDCEKFGLGPLQKAQLLSEYFVNSVEQEFWSTKGELTASVSGSGVSASASESDVSYGAGVNFALSDKIQMNAEYMQYIDKGRAEVSGFLVGASYFF
jgi:opacity protein-like surface antigen